MTSGNLLATHTHKHTHSCANIVVEVHFCVLERQRLFCLLFNSRECVCVGETHASLVLADEIGADVCVSVCVKVHGHLLV